MASTPAPTADNGAPAAASGPEQIETVTVTANRRRENLQDVPLAISAVTAESAAQMGITDPQSLASAIPGLNFNRQAVASIPFLRGVGTPVGEAGDEPSVALYVDDVYIPGGSASLSNFTSLESIEVDKGPQGTLFGRNATGGVIQVRTKNPTETPEFDATLGYANYDTTSGNLYASGGIAQNLSANISLYGANQQNGWGVNTTTGHPTFTGWDWGGRAKLLWTPTDTTTALLIIDHDTTRTEEGIGLQPRAGTGSLDPLPPFPNGGFAAGSFYNNSSNLDTYGRIRQSGVSLNVTQEFDFAKLVSITAWRFTKAEYLLDEDIGPVPLVNVDITTIEHTWTQELRLQSLDNSKTQWVVGAYYFKDYAGFAPLAFTGAAFAPLPYADAYGLDTTKSWSGFGQVTQTVLPDTRVTVGLRYTSDAKSIDAGAVLGSPVFFPAPNTPQSTTFDKLTYRFGLDHSFTESLLGYIGYNRGFKSGLYNPVILPGTAIAPPVAPEVLDSYTVGAKSEFLDHRLRVNAEAFYYKYKNIQVDQIESGVTFITNAAAATIKGLDLDVTAIPIERLTIMASIEVLDGKYDSYPNGAYFVYNPVTGGNCALTTAAGSCPGVVPGAAGAPPGYTGTSWDLAGNKTIQTPPFSSSLAVNYEIPSQIGKFNLSVNWSHTGDYFYNADNGHGQITPNNDKQPLIDLFNASVSLQSLNKRWDVRAWGKNLSGVKYIAYGDEDSFATQQSPAPPRTFGLTVTAHIL